MNYDQANKWMDSRLDLLTNKNSRQIAADIPAKIRAQMFFSATVADARVLEKIREVTTAYFRGELGLSEARKRFAQWIDARGIGDPTDRRISNIASAGRIDLILSQQAKMGAAVGRYQVSLPKKIIISILIMAALILFVFYFNMNAHLAKPVEPDHLYQILGELIYAAEASRY